MPRRLLICLLCLAGQIALLPSAATASGDSYQQVLQAYRSQGSVPACRFTSPQLQDALKSIDTYGAEYFSDFATAIQNALAQRASGACGGARQSLVERFGSLSSRAAARSAKRLAPLTAATSAGIPLALLLLALLAGTGAAGGLLAGLWRWSGWTPSWWLAWRHALAEAAQRTAMVWMDFTDWIRSSP